MTADSVRNYQLQRRKQAAEAATVNRETSALSRMFQLAIRRGQLERMPLFPKRLEENPPRDGFFEHDQYLKVRVQLPRSFQDVLDFAYYSGWRRNEILELTWDEVDMKGGVIRLMLHVQLSTLRSEDLLDAANKRRSLLGLSTMQGIATSSVSC
jgi:integrase